MKPYDPNYRPRLRRSKTKVTSIRRARGHQVVRFIRSGNGFYLHSITNFRSIFMEMTNPKSNGYTVFHKTKHAYRIT